MNKLILEEAYTQVIELAIHNPSGAETGIFWENAVNAMAADDLAPCVIRRSTAMVLTMQNIWVLVFHGTGIPLSLPFQCWKMTENPYTLYLLEINSTQYWLIIFMVKWLLALYWLYLQGRWPHLSQFVLIHIAETIYGKCWYSSNLLQKSYGQLWENWWHKKVLLMIMMVFLRQHFYSTYKHIQHM